MQDITSWIIVGLLIIFVISYILIHKQNVRLLTKEENDKRLEGLSQAMNQETKYLWIILAFFIGLIILEKLLYFPNFISSIILLCSVSYGVFRNIWIYRKINLPIKFIKNELFLGIITCSFLSIYTCLTIFENKQ